VNLDGTIPDDNPLTSETMVTACSSTSGAWSMAAPDKRVYAWGLRNPFRFWVDPHTGRMWIGDVGETTREELSVSDPAASYMGQHFGYPFVEGTADWGAGYMGMTGITDKKCDSMTPSRPCVAAATDYGHSGGANCMIGGLIPEGCGWSKAFGGTLHYWFADNGAGWIKGVEVKPDRSGVVSSTQIDIGTFNGSGPAAIRQGPAGAIYVVNNKQGSVYEIKPKDQTGDDCMSMGGMGGMGGMGASGGPSMGGSAGSAPASGGMTSAGTGGGMPMAGTGNATGGMPGTGGAMTSGTGGMMSSGGMAATTGGTGGAGGTGGSTGGSLMGTGGSAQAGTGAKPPAPKDDGGCGCRVGSSKSGALAALVGGLGLLGLALRRRRSRMS
jgi:MYXO-CTERM domain-containing protein